VLAQQQLDAVAQQRVVLGDDHAHVTPPAAGSR
jgi:hypothetical protein